MYKYAHLHKEYAHYNHCEYVPYVERPRRRFERPTPMVRRTVKTKPLTAHEMSRMKECVNSDESKQVKRNLIYQSGIDTTPDISSNNEVVTKDPSVVEKGGERANIMTLPTSSIRTISQKSIFERSYLLDYVVRWSTSDSEFTVLAELPFPRTFLEMTQIAPYGVTQYHALYKSNFKLTVRTDATNYNQGILMVFAVPGIETNYDFVRNLNYATAMNYPHVMLNVGLTSAVELEVPYGQKYNMIPPVDRNKYVSSRVVFLVWSPLRAGTSAPTVLNLSVWIEPKQPHVAGKTTALIAQSWVPNVVGAVAGSIIKPATHALLASGVKAVEGFGRSLGIYDRATKSDECNESARCGDEPACC